MLRRICARAGKKLGIFGKSFGFFLVFSLQRKPDTKLKNIQSDKLSINYNKTHKSHLTYEIKL